jgi:hypothetical protein
MTIAYVYKWTNIESLQWYVGSRTRKNCHPNDGYICSSKTVKPMIIENKNLWKREIISTGNPQDMRMLEQEILTLFDAVSDLRSLNRHNANDKFNGSVNAGKKKDPDHALKLRKNLFKQNSVYRKGKLGTFTDKKHSLESLDKMSLVKSGENNPNSKWLFKSPEGKVYYSPFDAAVANKCSHTTIYRWCKNQSNGWMMQKINKGE